jgi:NTP pyrophosphatase (non-canonical NTP hydrolase)
LTTFHFNRLTPAELERLAILAEECAEVGHMIGKILRHGYESFDPIPGHDPTQNRFLLEKELGDLMWAMRAMCLAHDINAERIEKHAQEKGPKATRYLHHQPIKHEPSTCCYGVGCNVCEPQGRG